MSDRYDRQRKILPPEFLERQNVVIAGVGAVGLEVLKTLTCNGIKNISIFDFDTVELTNCTTQGYDEQDVGKPKVEAAVEKAKKLNSEINISAFNDRWRPSKKRDSTVTHVFSCVDDLRVRELIHKWYRINLKSDNPPFLFDARLGGEQMRLFTVFDEKSDKHYPTTIGKNEDAWGDGCQVPMVKHACSIAAGLLVQQCIASLTNRPLFADRSFGLVSGDLFANKV